MIICTKCQTVYDSRESGFYRNKRFPNTFHWPCKQCCINKRKQQRANNLDKDQKYMREYRKNNREKCLAYSKKYRDENLDVCRKRARLKAAVYFRKNPDRARENKAARRARESGVKIETVLRRDIFHRTRGRCFYCRSPLLDGWHMDHLIPVVAGGAHEYSNIMPACPLCNMKKSTIPIGDYILSRWRPSHMGIPR